MFSTLVGLDSLVVIAVRPIGQTFTSKFTQKVLGKLTKYYGVVITIKNIVTKNLDDSALVHIELKDNINENHFKTFTLKLF